MKRGLNLFSREFHTRFSRAFSLIELLVTLSIMGLLLVTIMPILGRFGQDNNIKLASQTVREALIETQNYAISPNVSICPLRSGVTFLPKTINSYAFFATSSTGAPLPVSDSTKAANDAANVYKCGISDASTNIPSTQYAIVARHLDYDAVTGKILAEYILGVVRVGSLDSPANFAVVGNCSCDHSILIGYDSPSGRFVENKNTQLGYGTTGTFDYVPKVGDPIYAPPTTATSNLQYTLVGLANASGSHATTTLFINRATGQISSTGIVPTGF